MGTATSTQGEQPFPAKPTRRTAINDVADDQISGSYRSEVIGGKRLELRIDIDKTRTHSKVLNIISGEFIQGNDVVGYFRTSKIGRKENVITGTGVAHLNGGKKVPTQLSVKLQKEGDVWKADVRLPQIDASYECSKYSHYFRHVVVDIDYSGTDDLVLPTYNTSSHQAERVVHLDQRELSVFTPLEDAGIEVTLNEDMSTKVEDPDPTTAWTLSELYEVMQSHHNTDPATWNLWILLAPKYRDPRTVGLMFDRKNRKGFAIFTDHKWFKGMNEDAGSDKMKANALRKFIYTFVHEMGHSLNLQHSWDKGNPDSLSFMNYDYRYDLRNGVGSFFKEFTFSFDDDEIRFLRHGRSVFVQPGASPFLTDVPPSSLPADPDDDDNNNKRLKFTAKPSKTSYKQMELVRLQLKLRNCYKYPIYVGSKLDPSEECVKIFIMDPDGETTRVDSFASGVVSDYVRTLHPSGSPEGTDRISEEVSLVYGKDGFYFQKPGQYKIKAVYTFENYYLTTEMVKLNIQSYDGNIRHVDQFFTEEVGEYIALEGSNAPRYQNIRQFFKRLVTTEDRMEWVEDIVALCGKNLANSTRKGFSKTRNKVQVEKEDRGLVLDDVLQSTKSTIDKLHVDGNREDNIRYRHMTYLRAEILLEKQQFQEAEQLVNQMIEDLRSRGVKEYITREIKWEWLLRKGDVNSLPPGIDSQRREIWRTVPPKVTELQELVKHVVNWQDDESAIDDDEDDDDEESGIGRSTVFSTFNDEHLVLSSNVIQQIFAKADDCGDIVETLEFVDSLQKTRRYNNTLIQYALKIFLTHHAIARSNRLKVPEFIDEPSMMDTSAHAMVPPIGPPQEIWMDYWRNDAHFVDHHRHWHLVYRAHGLPGTDELHLDRQGELFGYMHAQLLARYNAERESWGLGPVEPWHFTDVDQLGCDVGEEFHSSQQNRGFRPRPPWTKFPRSRVVQFQKWTDNIRLSFREGILQPNSGTGLPPLNLDSNNDMQTPSYSAANWVGHIVEATSSTFYDTYGSIHNSGHVVFGSTGQRRGMSSYMSTTDHAVRDHIFFRWHTFIDNLIDEFHQTRITELAVDAPPVVITGNDVMISTSDSAPKGFTDWSENGWRNNYTHAGTIQTILDVAQYQFEWGKLSHEPFYFHIRVKRQRWTGSELRLTVRIFICPARHENDRRRWIEMDKFRYVMAATETHSTITRKDKHSSVIKRDPTDPDYSDDLEIPLARTVSGFCECGWPYNLLLPKGTKDGEPYRLAVLISDNNVDALKIRSQCGSLSYCGSRDNRYPDRRQMGYPFATPMAVNGKEVSITEALEQLPNFAASSFVIENRDVRFGEILEVSGTEQALYLTSWSAHSQAEQRRHEDYKTSKWNGRLRVLIDGRFIDETNAFADTGYTKIRLQGRGLGNGKYSINDVTLAERQGRTLNTIGKIYQITFNNGETSTIVPETGLESDAIEMVFAPETDYFVTFTLEAPGVYLVTNGDVTYTWRMAEPDERGREKMNWDLDDIQSQITQTRSNIYVIDKILVNVDNEI